MSQNKLLFILFSFSFTVHLLYNMIFEPTSSWMPWTMNIAQFLVALLFLHLILKEKRNKKDMS